MKRKEAFSDLSQLSVSASASSAGDEQQPNVSSCQHLCLTAGAGCPGFGCLCSSPALKQRAVCWKSCAKPLWGLSPFAAFASATSQVCTYLATRTLDLELEPELEQCWLTLGTVTRPALLLLGYNGAAAGVGPLPALLPPQLPKPYRSFPPHTLKAKLRSRQASGREKVVRGVRKTVQSTANRRM